MTSATQNMHSACSHTEIVDDYLLKELKRGSIAGPFNALPSPSLHINRFGLIPKSRNPHLLKLLRHMAYFAIKFNFNFSAVHVEGKLNQKADALSRFRFQVFRELCPSADAVATDIDLPCSKTYFVRPRFT